MFTLENFKPLFERNRMPDRVPWFIGMHQRAAKRLEAQIAELQAELIQRRKAIKYLEGYEEKARQNAELDEFYRGGYETGH